LLVDESAPPWTAAFIEGVSEYETATGNALIDVDAVPYKNESNWQQGKYNL